MFNNIQIIARLAHLKTMARDESGASLAEIALLLGLIAGSAVLTLAGFSSAVAEMVTATTGIVISQGGGG